jgi:glycerol-3-phosphate dehydrogenase (NAD(P)+)
MSEVGSIGIVGGGAWGTALAQVAACAGDETVLWAREPDVAESINTRHENILFLPGVPLAESLRATSELGDLAACDALLVVTPAQHTRAVLGALDVASRPLVLCSKGIEDATGQLMHEVAREAQPRCSLAVLSGPTFAHEVAAGLPTAVTLACGDGQPQWRRLSQAIARPAFRPYYSDDVTGAEIGGAVKNVLAIACGVVDGLRLGQDARAALIARGFAEMLRFGQALGARAETLTGLSGLGDLVLTCSSTASRNFSLGKALGEGVSAAEAMSGRLSVAEGAHTAPILAKLASERRVEMPIVDAVCALLAGELPASEAVEMLLARPLRAEMSH